jgi:hypothetical protein
MDDPCGLPRPRWPRPGKADEQGNRDVELLDGPARDREQTVRHPSAPEPAGGALETVSEGVSGGVFDHPDVDALRFDRSVFLARWRELVSREGFRVLVGR